MHNYNLGYTLLGMTVQVCVYVHKSLNALES